MTVKVTTLPGGLRVATDRMDGVATVSLGVYIDAGARHEPAPINGVAHFLEHMAFKGTERRSARAIAEEIEAVGGHLNAYTAREQTAYYAKVLKDDVPLALDILSDILLHSTFDQSEFDRERSVILQEIGQAEDTPDDIVFDHFQATAYPDQAMGRPVLGTVETVSALPRTALVDYMAANYHGPDMVVSAAGAVDHDRIVELATAAFAGIPGTPAAKAEAGHYVGGDFREERDLEQIHLVVGFPGVSYTDPDHHAFQVLATILGGGMSSRLFQEIREKRGLAYSIYAFSSSFHDGGIFGVYAGTGEKDVKELLPVLCDEVMAIGGKLEPGELARAKAQLRASLLMSRESTSARAEHLAHQLLVHGGHIPTEDTLAKLEAVDADAVARVARRLHQAPPTLTAMGPIGGVEPFDRIVRRLAA
ncbi:putative Zn-dependent peptidase [Stella humosa]|uniref:Putative Zn-dependent peptidase n=1 Tax=Stella humosa TaxID=94 RepID=A0A3N1LJS6_9PROT|nr:pitrilysin family protein [Stella humosa]ROP91118.1 putative Zn-dependent peptidase [Stella humosa]BBK34530.1 peptidase M16 [Stella humosa]